MNVRYFINSKTRPREDDLYKIDDNGCWFYLRNKWEKSTFTPDEFLETTKYVELTEEEVFSELI